MPALSTAEHQSVQQETKAARNAHASATRLSRKDAERWCAEVGAEVQRWDHHGEWRWTIRVPGLLPRHLGHPGAGRARPGRDHLRVVRHEGERGPTGASLTRTGR